MRCTTSLHFSLPYHEERRWIALKPSILLYQGTTSVVPQGATALWALALGNRSDRAAGAGAKALLLQALCGMAEAMPLIQIPSRRLLAVRNPDRG